MRSFIALLVSLSLSVPAAAWACGGFFCSSFNLVPIEQNAERILFLDVGDGTMTMVVGISYSGSPEDFSWVVPINGDPLLDENGDPLSVAPPQTLLLLEDATAVQVIPPPTKCSDLLAPGANRAVFGGAEASDLSDGGVEVEDLPQVGPYLPQVVSSDDPQALVTWLNDNGYLITPEMEPYVADYVAEGMKFLAMKMEPGAEVADISPIVIRTEGDTPTIPIELTSVAAEPEMGVLVFAAGQERFESSNYADVVVETDEVQADPRNGMTNYYPLLSWKVDTAGGRGVVTQFAGQADSVDTSLQNSWSWNPDYSAELDWIASTLAQYPYLTRMYTRMSGWEMTADPAFERSSGSDVSGTFDLSDRPAVEVCDTGSDDLVPCGETYCGVDAYCATTSAGDGCVCPPGSVARAINAPRSNNQGLLPTVVCQLSSFDLMSSVSSTDLQGVGTDPCASTSCGEYGDCVALNGFPTCQCDEGYAAVADFGGSLTCVQVGRTYGPEQLLWQSACSCTAARSEMAPGGGLVLLLFPWLARRRRVANGAGTR